MKKRTKEEMATYQKFRRAALKGVTLTVTPGTFSGVTSPLEPVTPARNVIVTSNIVTPCSECLDRDLQIKKLTVRVAFLEKSMERYAALDKSQKSSYRLGPEFSRL